MTLRKESRPNEKKRDAAGFIGKENKGDQMRPVSKFEMVILKENDVPRFFVERGFVFQFEVNWDIIKPRLECISPWQYAALFPSWASLHLYGEGFFYDALKMEGFIEAWTRISDNGGIWFVLGQNKSIPQIEPPTRPSEIYRMVKQVRDDYWIGLSPNYCNGQLVFRSTSGKPVKLSHGVRGFIRRNVEGPSGGYTCFEEITGRKIATGKTGREAVKNALNALKKREWEEKGGIAKSLFEALTRQGISPRYRWRDKWLLKWSG